MTQQADLERFQHIFFNQKTNCCMLAVATFPPYITISVYTYKLLPMSAIFMFVKYMRHRTSNVITLEEHNFEKKKHKLVGCTHENNSHKFLI